SRRSSMRHVLRLQRDAPRLKLHSPLRIRDCGVKFWNQPALIMFHIARSLCWLAAMFICVVLGMCTVVIAQDDEKKPSAPTTVVEVTTKQLEDLKKQIDNATDLSDEQKSRGSELLQKAAEALQSLNELTSAREVFEQQH